MSDTSNFTHSLHSNYQWIYTTLKVTSCQPAAAPNLTLQTHKVKKNTKLLSCVLTMLPNSSELKEICSSAKPGMSQVSVQLTQWLNDHGLRHEQGEHQLGETDHPIYHTVPPQQHLHLLPCHTEQNYSHVKNRKENGGHGQILFLTQTGCLFHQCAIMQHKINHILAAGS